MSFALLYIMAGYSQSIVMCALKNYTTQVPLLTVSNVCLLHYHGTYRKKNKFVGDKYDMFKYR